jgi:outer membrane protein with beta-barrel domain
MVSDEQAYKNFFRLLLACCSKIATMNCFRTRIFSRIDNKTAVLQRNLVFSLLCILLNLCCLAQHSRIEAGIKTGLAASKLSANSQSSGSTRKYSPRTGYTISAYFGFNFLEDFSIVSQLQYSSYGGKLIGPQEVNVPAGLQNEVPKGEIPEKMFADYESELRLNYLSVPLLIKYNMNLTRRCALYMASGPFAAILLNAKKINNGQSNLYADEKLTQPVSQKAYNLSSRENMSNRLNRFNAGIGMHIGLFYRMSKGSIFAEAGAELGILNIRKTGSGSNNKTEATSFNIGYQFPLSSTMRHSDQ